MVYDEGTQIAAARFQLVDGFPSVGHKCIRIPVDVIPPLPAALDLFGVVPRLKGVVVPVVGVGDRRK
jgi:hypothetical protein